jgi:hypothetical protein
VKESDFNFVDGKHCLYAFCCATTPFESLFREGDPSASSYYNSALSLVRVGHPQMARTGSSTITPPLFGGREMSILSLIDQSVKVSTRGHGAPRMKLNIAHS